MDIQQLRTFLHVVDAGSFAAAARRLDVGPSAVTRSVAALEAELGLRLLQRTTRRLAVTEAGAAYCEQVRLAVEAIDQAADAAQAAQGSAAGPVRLTASVAYGQRMLVPLLPALHRSHPQLSLELLLTDTPLDLVAERVDLAIRLGPATDSSMVGQQLATVRYRVAASPAWLAQHGTPTEPADLAGHDCLRFALPGYRTLWSFRAVRPQRGAQPVQRVPVRGWLVLSTALAVHGAARDGLGPALLPEQ